MQVQAYLFFDGRCEEALTFYSEALGAKVEMMMRFRDNPEPPSEGDTSGGCVQVPGSEDKIMHASFRIGDSIVMASDGNCGGNPSFQGFSLTLNANDDAHAHQLFEALSRGGQILMPLQKTFFASSFGMLADRFGMNWMVINEA